MKAIILAGGQSKRLRPLTNKKPKCLLPVRGKPIIDYQISALIRNGITEIVVVVGFEKEQIIDSLLANYPEISFTFIYNEKFKSTGPAYGLWLAKDHLADTILYLNADVLYGANIIKRVRKNKRSSVTAVQRTNYNDEQVNVSVNENHLITRIGKNTPKEKSYGEFIGVTKFDDSFCKKLVEVLDHFVKKGELDKFAADAINSAIGNGGNIYVVDTTDLKTLEVDTLEDLKKAERMFGSFVRFKQNHPFFSAQGFWAKIKRTLSSFIKV